MDSQRKTSRAEEGVRSRKWKQAQIKENKPKETWNDTKSGKSRKHRLQKANRRKLEGRKKKRKKKTYYRQKQKKKKKKGG